MNSLFVFQKTVFHIFSNINRRVLKCNGALKQKMTFFNTKLDQIRSKFAKFLPFLYSKIPKECLGILSVNINEHSTRVIILSYLYSGLRPSVRGKITSDNGNLRNLLYTKNICHVILALITPIIPVRV